MKEIELTPEQEAIAKEIEDRILAKSGGSRPRT